MQLGLRPICNTPQNSPKFSCAVSFTAEEEQTYLQRAKNLGMADKACLELTQQIVQNVNSHIASSKNKNAQRFLGAETKWILQSKDISKAAAARGRLSDGHSGRRWQPKRRLGSGQIGRGGPATRRSISA